MTIKSVQSINPCPSGRQAGVDQMSYNMVKAQGGVPIAIGIKVESPPRSNTSQTESNTGSLFSIILPAKSKE